MNPIDIIVELYAPGSKAYHILIQHGQQVAHKAVAVAKKIPHLKPDLDFIKEAAMLHDIGIFMTNSPELGCTGEYPYVCHGYLGRKILENRQLPAHALVCERHVGVGITLEDVRHLSFPEQREMVPVSTEEQIVCYADKFFSKNGKTAAKEKSVEEIKCGLELYGHDKILKYDKILKFQLWADLFGE